MRREAEHRPDVIHLMKLSEVGPVTALTFVLTIGPVSHFQRSKQVVPRGQQTVAGLSSTSIL